MHLYGIVEAAEDHELHQLGQRQQSVRIVTGHGLGIAFGQGDGVGPADLSGLSREELVPLLVTHQSVLEDLMRAMGSVIPLAFGTRVRQENDLRALLTSGRWRFREAVERLRGKVEFEIAAYWPAMEPVLARISRQPEVTQLRMELTRGAVTLEDKIRLGRLVESRLTRLRQDTASQVIARLESVLPACQMQLPPLMDDAQVVTVALLVPRDLSAVVEEAVQVADSAWGGELNFRLIGPLPPHSFCTLSVRRPNLQTIQQAMQVLGLGSTFSAAQLQVVYRQQASRHHPDRSACDSSRFDQLQEAYRCLSELAQHSLLCVTQEALEAVFMLEEVRLGEPRAAGQLGGESRTGSVGPKRLVETRSG